MADALWERGGALAKYTTDGAVVAIPARDMCVLCDAHSAKGLERVRKVATQPLADASHALTQKLFARREGRWRELETTDPRDAPLEFK